MQCERGEEEEEEWWQTKPTNRRGDNRLSKYSGLGGLSDLKSQTDWLPLGFMLGWRLGISHIRRNVCHSFTFISSTIFSSISSEPYCQHRGIETHIRRTVSSWPRQQSVFLCFILIAWSMGSLTCNFPSSSLSSSESDFSSSASSRICWYKCFLLRRMTNQLHCHQTSLLVFQSSSVNQFIFICFIVRIFWSFYESSLL